MWEGTFDVASRYEMMTQRLFTRDDSLSIVYDNFE